MEEEYQLEMENRIKNLMWTVSGDYKLDMKPDVAAFLRSKYVALYDGVKQGAFAKYFNREELSLYLVKKVFLQGLEGPLMTLTQLCIEQAIYRRLTEERKGVSSIRVQAYEDILEQDFTSLSKTPLGHLKIALLKEGIKGHYEVSKGIRQWMDQINTLENAKDTKSIIIVIDHLYNEIVDPHFIKNHGDLETVLAVTLEELTEYSWKDYLSEEMYEETLESYMEKVSENMTSLEMLEEKKEEETESETSVGKKTIRVVNQEDLDKMYTYIERNYGKTYQTPQEEKRLNYHMCRGIHEDCSLYYTEGILKNPALRNYQYEYARKQKDKNLFEYYDNHRAVKRNISILSEMLKKAFVLREEVQEIISDRGHIIPAALWKVGRSQDAKIFKKEIKNDNIDFAVEILIDASGSQRSRQGKVAIQAYIISEALSDMKIPHQVLSFCSFWDYTVLHRFRRYEDDRAANQNIFEYVTSSNNRDGLAIKAAGYELLEREEGHKVLIVLSDGKPYDVIMNRPNAKNSKPYQGEEAIKDTGFEIRKLRDLGVSVLGVFAGEDKDLSTEKKIFGKDFAYIRNISNFSNMVGRYLLKQLEDD